MGAVDDYLAGLDPAYRSAALHIYAVAVKLAPDTEQGTSYGMAALRYKGKPLLALKAAKAHLSVFPFSPAAVDAAREHLAGFDISKGTVRFTPDSPPSDAAIKAMVMHRMAEID